MSNSEGATSPRTPLIMRRLDGYSLPGPPPAPPQPHPRCPELTPRPRAKCQDRPKLNGNIGLAFSSNLFHRFWYIQAEFAKLPGNNRSQGKMKTDETWALSLAPQHWARTYLICGAAVKTTIPRCPASTPRAGNEAPDQYSTTRYKKGSERHVLCVCVCVCMQGVKGGRAQRGRRCRSFSLSPSLSHSLVASYLSLYFSPRCSLSLSLSRSRSRSRSLLFTDRFAFRDIRFVSPAAKQQYGKGFEKEAL
jgi:hypothetical protein